MNNLAGNKTEKRRWPWFLLAVFLFGVALAILWLSKEIRRVKRIKESTASQAGFAPPDLPLSRPASNSWTNDMVWIPAGTFWMGSDDGQSDEKPVHQVKVEGFWMDKTEVTNEQFEKFVRATRYVTIAERKPDANDYPGVPPDRLVAGSIVFRPKANTTSLENHFAWWEYVPGANWRHPDGPHSSLEGREKHPVVHICWEDA